VTEAADRKPFFAVGDARRAASLASTTIIFDCVYCKADAGREGDKVVDRHHLADEGVGRAWWHHDRSGALPRGYQIINSD
jgi:hypothetical protein